jgi:hypothetical protein
MASRMKDRACLKDARRWLPLRVVQEHSSGLHKQLREAQRQEQALLEKLGASEGARQQQEMRLEAGGARPRWQLFLGLGRRGLTCGARARATCSHFCGRQHARSCALQAAAEQVSAMRSELQLLNAKLAARDKQLLQHVKVGRSWALAGQTFFMTSLHVLKMAAS